MSNQAIARRFRPQTFTQVIGQSAIVQAFTNTLTRGTIHHAFTFIGTRGVGKTSMARIVAKALNCEKGVTVEPCGQCYSCEEISQSRSLDVVEIDAASNTGVDNVRNEVIETAYISPVRDRHKIFIIDEVHMLSVAAFNALLKTLEEPPPRVIFFLATTDPKKIPATILSRCQIFEFHAIRRSDIVEQLRRICFTLDVGITEKALQMIAEAGDGSMRDAESALDQVIAFAGESVYESDVSTILGLIEDDLLYRTVEAVAAKQPLVLLNLVTEVATRGYDLRNFCRDLMSRFRALLAIKMGMDDAEALHIAEEQRVEFTLQSLLFSERTLLRFFGLLSKTETDIRSGLHPQFQLEMGLIKLTACEELESIEVLIKRFRGLEQQLGTAVVQVPATVASNQSQASGQIIRPRTDATPPPPRPPARQGAPAPPAPPAPPVKEDWYPDPLKGISERLISELDSLKIKDEQ